MQSRCAIFELYKANLKKTGRKYRSTPVMEIRCSYVVRLNLGREQSRWAISVCNYDVRLVIADYRVRLSCIYRVRLRWTFMIFQWGSWFKIKKVSTFACGIKCVRLKYLIQFKTKRSSQLVANATVKSTYSPFRLTKNKINFLK